MSDVSRPAIDIWFKFRGHVHIVTRGGIIHSINNEQRHFFLNFIYSSVLSINKKNFQNLTFKELNNPYIGV